MATILVAHGDRLICELLAEVLGARGHDVVTAVTCAEALAQYRHHRPQLTLLDSALGKPPDVLALHRTIDAHASVVQVAESDRGASGQTGPVSGATGCVSTGQCLDTLFRMVDRSLAERAPRAARRPSWTTGTALVRVK